MPKVSGEDVTNADALPGEVGYMPQLHENDDEEPVAEEDLEPEPDDDSDGQETVTLNLS